MGPPPLTTEGILISNWKISYVGLIFPHKNKGEEIKERAEERAEMVMRVLKEVKSTESCICGEKEPNTPFRQFLHAMQCAE